MSYDIYRCPVCGGKLNKNEMTLKCEKNHSFDIAKQGYVNLLTGSSASHGDGEEMMLARRAFLTAGSYSPLRDKIFEVMNGKIKNTRVLDSGCGDGYYTQKFTELENCCVYGIDLSKLGVKKTAVSLKDKGEAVVGSVYCMPFLDESFGCVVNIFSPLATEEYKRVLKKDGVLIIAYPLPNHLYELKKVLYDEVKIKDTEDTALEGFILQNSYELTYKMDLDKEQLKNLFVMTPYYYNSPKKGAEKLYSLSALEVTASFGILSYTVKK